MNRSLALLFAAAALAPALALAQPAASQPAGAADALRRFAERTASAKGTRAEASVGVIPTHGLAACRRSEPFLPQGNRLWGRSALGLRCVEGASWQVFVPVYVRIHGHALVATRALAQNAVLGAEDTRPQEIELTRYPEGALADAQALRDKQLARALAAGQPLLREHLRVRMVLAQGDSVKLVYEGPGFAISTQARALSHAAEGQSVRVVTDSGRTVTGIARPNRVVELTP
jgi:flagella basal body P-ring formation protein FlgA